MQYTGRVGVMLVLAGWMVLGGESAAQQPAPPPTSVAAHVRDWPRPSQLAAEMITQKYGPPRDMTETMLVWGEAGPWKRTIVYRDGIPHNFPEPHTDVIQQFINYQVPLDMFDDLAEFDGSVLADRTRGEVSVRCDSEGSNFAVINLTNELLSGKRSIQDTRRTLALQIAAMRAGRSAPYTARLMFTPPINAADPDSPVMR